MRKEWLVGVIWKDIAQSYLTALTGLSRKRKMKQEKHLSHLHHELLSDISLAFFSLFFLGFWGFGLFCLFFSNISVFNAVIVLIRLLKYTASPNSSPTKIYPLACLGTHNLQMEMLDTHVGTSSSNKLTTQFLKRLRLMLSTHFSWDSWGSTHNYPIHLPAVAEQDRYLNYLCLQFVLQP